MDASRIAGTSLLERIDAVTAGVPHSRTKGCHLLFHLAVHLRAAHILEVSCCYGKATTYLAAAAGRTDGIVHAADDRLPTHNGMTAHDLAKAAGVDMACDIRLETDGRWFLLDLFRENPELRLDLAFIDCSHAVDVDAFIALSAWVHLRPGGIIIFDDLNWIPAQHTCMDPCTRPEAAHIREIYDHIRSLPDAGDSCEWLECVKQDEGFDWPWGLVRKAGTGDEAPLPRLIEELAAIR